MDAADLEAINEHAIALLQEGDIAAPPTPLDQILWSSRLSLSEFDFPQSAGIPEHLAESVRAFIEVPEKTIHISKQLHKKKRRFGSFHEVGHYILPWHRELLYFCSEFDLSLKARQKLDVEANAFAAACLFQGDRFTKEAEDYRIRMSSIIELAETYEVSFESAARRFVQQSKNPCALLVCLPIRRKKFLSAPGFKVLYTVKSDLFPFWLPHGAAFSSGHIISQLCFNEPQRRVSAKLEIMVHDGDMFKCVADVFFNGYRALVLLRPRKFKGRGHPTTLRN